MDDIAVFRFVYRPRDFLPPRFKGGDDVELFAVVITGGDGAAIDEDGGAVEPQLRHQRAGHILVAADDGDERVVTHRLHKGFDGVGDDVARDQRVTHPLRPHRDTVADADGVENEADAVGFLHAAFDFAGEVV